MIELANFKPEHLVNIKKEDLDARIITFLGNIDMRAEEYAKAGPAVSILDGETILSIGGVINFWPGVGEVWQMLSPEGRLKGLIVYRYMSDFVQRCFNEYGYHRIQASILYDHKEAHKSILRLGFIPEGMMVYYGPSKENYIRYAKVK